MSYTLTLPICRQSLSQDISGDFSLPDYQPEIKRLLRISASMTPPITTAMRDHIQMVGNIDYFVLYTGNDNKLYCAPLTTNYDITAPLSDSTSPLQHNQDAWVGDEPTFTCLTEASSITGRVTAPRRLSIKCRIDADIKGYATCPTGLNSPNIETGVETLMDTTSCISLLRTTGQMTLQDDMISPPNDTLRVVCAEGAVMLQDVVMGQNTLTCHGDVWLKLTLDSENPQPDQTESISIIRRKIPFSQVVELPGVTPTYTGTATGTCAEMSVTLGDGHLHTEMNILLEVIAQGNIPTPYVKDLYATERTTQSTYAPHSTEQATLCHMGNFTLSETLMLSDVNIPTNAEIIDITMTATPQDLQWQNSKCILSGICHMHLILKNQDEYTAREIDRPYRYEFDHRIAGGDNMNPDTMCFQGQVKAVSCRARMDGERLGIDAEMGVTLRVTQKGEITTLSSVSVGESVARPHGEYTICFPSRQDTLWTVAKRYHAPLTALSAANGLTSLDAPDAPSSLDGVKFLIV